MLQRCGSSGLVCVFMLIFVTLDIAAVSGQNQVTSYGGSPLSGAVVQQIRPNQLQMPPDDDKTTAIATTGEDGVFTPDSSSTGTLVVVSRAGFATRAFDGAKPLPPRILLTEETEIAGTVFDAAGAAAAGVLIGPVRPVEAGEEVDFPEEKPLVPPVWTRTDSAGAFRVGGLSSGFYNFLVNAPGHAPQMAAATAGEQTSVTLSAVGTTSTGVLVGSRDGLPQAGVWVEAASAVFELMKVYARTGPQGDFQFPPLQADYSWRYSTSLSPADKAKPAKVAKLEGWGDGDQILLLHNQGVAITGRIYDSETSIPISGLALQLAEFRKDDPYTAITNQEGFFRFDKVDAFKTLNLRFDDSPYLYRSLAEGRWNEHVSIVTDAGADITSISLRLRARIPVKGKVVGPEMRPAPGAQVTLRSHQSVEQGFDELSKPMIYKAVTGPAGEFETELFPPGAYDASAETGMLASKTIVYEASTTAPAELVINVSPLMLVTGQTLDPDGKSLIEARIEMTTLSDSSETSGLPAGRLIQSTRSDNTGEFVMEGVFPDTFRLTATHPVFEAAVTTDVVLLRTTGSINLQFPAGKLFSVQVLDEQSMPVEGAAVQVFTADETKPDSSATKQLSLATNAEGRTLFAVAAERLQNVVVRHPSFAPFHAGDFGLPLLNYTIHLKPHPSVLVGLTAPSEVSPDSLDNMVYLLAARGGEDATEEPLPSRFVTIKTEQAIAGKALFSNVEPGWYKAAVTTEDESFYSETEAIRITPDSPPVELELALAQGTSVSGRITDEATGEPVQGAEVSVKLQSGTPTDFEIVSKPSDAQGRYKIAVLPAGEVFLTARHSAHTDKAQVLTIPASGDMTVDITMGQSVGSLGGQVTVDGKPLRDATIIVYPNADMGPWIGSAVTDEDGRYHIENVPEGARLLIVEALWGNDKDALRQRQTVLVQGENTVADVAFRGLVRVAGRLHRDSADEYGDRMLIMYFTARAAQGDVRIVPVDVDGQFEVLLEPGSYTVGLQDGPGIPLDVPEGNADFTVNYNFAELAEISGLRPHTEPQPQ